MDTWDSKKLWLKARSFMDKANSFDSNSPEFPFWCALALECLARSALTKIHPALNADPRNDENLLYGFGFNVTAQPRSLPAHSVYIRLEKAIDGFHKTHRELCDYMSLLRNAQLHTAELPYANLKISKWLPRFYEVVKILNKSLGKDLEEFVGSQNAAAAHEHIKTLTEEIKGSVKSKLSAHAKIFEGKSAAEKVSLKEKAENATLALFRGSIAAKCPACSSKGILKGQRIRELEPVYENEQLTVEEVFLVSEFHCLACDLSLKGLQEITYADLEPEFSGFRSTSLHELYEPEHYREYDNM